MADDPRSLLRIYLNDHLSGSTAWLALAQRTHGSNPDGELGEFLAVLVRELEEERAALLRIVESLGLRRNPVKEAVIRAAVGAGRLKLNGRLRGYSDLSRVLELEGLTVGIEANRVLWASLRETGRSVPVDLDGLLSRAERRRTELERHRLEAARRAFGEAGG